MIPDRQAILSILPLLRDLYPRERWPSATIAAHLNTAFVNAIQADYISLAHTETAEPWRREFIDLNALSAALLLWVGDPGMAGSGVDWNDIDLADGLRAMEEEA